jgi:hypothetical protein
MELIHKINGVIIEEPIGFDQLKMTMQRTEYHGISAEVSQLDLEFYGKAATIIKEAYETDLDTELNYIVTNNGVEVYNGMVDLSTYQETEGSYRSVSCKVGEIGVKTIFNNRSETEVDLNSDTTIDGEELALRPTWQSLHIPTKHFPYTNLFKQEDTKTYETISPIGKNKGKHFIPIHFENKGVNEYGTSGNSERVMDCEWQYMGGSVYVPGNIPLANDTNMCVFEEGSEFEEKFGKDTTHSTIMIKATVGVKLCDDILPMKNEFYGNGSEGNSTGNRYYTAKLVLMQEDGTIVWEAKGTSHIAPGQELGVYTLNTEWEGDDPDDPMSSTETIHDIPTNQRLYFGVLLETDWRYEITAGGGQYQLGSEPLNNECTPTITIYKDSYIKTLMFDNLQEETKNTNMLMVYDALKTISLITTENKLPLKSDWYDYSDLSGNIVEQHGGATKAITNGYKIRDVKTNSGKEYPMSLSFRDLFESLNAMDCIGWSIVEEDYLCLRVERWDWFYKDEEVLEIEDANELKTSLNKDLCVTEFEIGYDKYVTSDVYNSIDNLHSERKFASAVKALNNKVSAKSKIIADNYAIEETRRAQFQVKPSESFEHDESVFVFELGKDGGSFIIRSSADDCTGIKRPIEFINAKLTPRQCAARWADYLFAMNGAKVLKYVTSSANSEAGFSTDIGSLLLSMADNPQMENGDIGRKPHKLKAETLEFTYPLTIEQYKRIKNNPYGLITVNGIQGWLKEFTYSFVDGEAEFKLIPKAK